MAEALSSAAVQAYLHEHIPLSAMIGVEVVACTRAGVVLRAPLAPNINHRATVFGGSISAVAILAAWTWLHFALREAELASRLVIQRNTVEYLAPIDGDFEVRCDGVLAEQFDGFARQLRRLGKARVELEARLFFAGKIAAEFRGDYVAFRAP